MTIDLYQEVYLTRDVPEKQLRKGDVAVLVDDVPHPTDRERGAILEIFNAVGESVDVVTVPFSVIGPLRADLRPTVRPTLAVA